VGRPALRAETGNAPGAGGIEQRMTSSDSSSSKRLTIVLWTVQVLLALTFVGGGLWKLATPIPELGAKMPWMGQVSPSLVRLTAVFDVLGGLGVLLPSATRIKPRVTVAAALGCSALMVAAILFHVSRGEAANTPFNFLLLGLALFVAWGRSSKAAIAERRLA
jgi:uncharacterized membrane protein YphA (DoxX/SURF4 family)